MRSIGHVIIISRTFSTTVKTPNKTFPTPNLSEVVKQFSKFSSSHDGLLEYSQRPIEYYYPNRMLAAATPDRLASLNLVDYAANLHDQLLVRIAHGIHHFQSLPFLPAANPILLSLHERYLKLFESIAEFPKVRTNDDEERFAEFIMNFLRQTNNTIGRLSAGCQEAQRYFKSYRIMKDFLDQVLSNRLTMRLLAEHYLEIRKQCKKRLFDDQWRGAIQMNFSPAQLVQQCIEDVTTICFNEFGVAPPVQIENHLHHSLPYFNNVVEYILRELLKNSMRAVVEYHDYTLGNLQNVKRHFDENRDLALCKVLITSDPEDEHFTIAIKDQGGGINEAEEQIFRYMFTGKKKKKKKKRGNLSHV